MKQIFIALVAGTLFGAGLAFSGMVDPARVQAFLDILGNWDPTLAFVMGGALIPMAIAWRVQKSMSTPAADEAFNLPGTTKLDSKLVSGAILFGVGWGIAGLCPGPAIADLALNPLPALAFVAAMLAGMAIHRITAKS